MTNTDLIYNTPQEIAIRLLVVLLVSKNKLSKDRLIFFDFLTIHTSTFSDTNKSIHPDNPYFGLEFFSKNTNTEKAVHLLVHKKLINSFHDEGGYYFEINNMGKYILSLINGPYKNQVVIHAGKVIEEFSSLTDQDIRKYFDLNLIKWSAEQ